MIKLAEQTIGRNELESLSSWVLQNEQLTKGPLTLQFEAAFAEYIGSKFAVFVNSGSSANLLIAQALKVSGRLRNQRVICPAVSWVTTVTPFLQLGYDVKLCDCSSNDLGLDTASLEQMIVEHDPALMVIVDVLGHPNDMASIQSLCDRYDVALVEDSCEALGSFGYGKMLGRHGIAGSYSFYYGHHISTIEGGMVVTDDEELWNLMKSIRSHGWGRDVDIDILNDWRNDTGVAIDDFRNLYTFYYSGFNLRATDLQAFIGLSQIKKLPDIARQRARNFERYRENLKEFFCQVSNVETLSSFAYGTLVTDPSAVGEYLLKNGVESRPLICGNIGRHPFWSREFGVQRNVNADLVHDFGIYLPNHHLLTHEQIDTVCELFRGISHPKFFDGESASWRI